jgi:type IV pilus assembly protein PilP
VSLQGLISLIGAPRRQIALVSIATALMTACADSKIEDLQQFVAKTKASTAGNKLEPLPSIEPYRPFAYTAQGLKDPFVLAAFVQQEFLVDIPPENIKEDSGIRPDPTRPREELEKYALGSLKMVGTLQKDGMWALIKAPDGIVHRVRSGNYLGFNHGKVINVTERRIDLTEIVPDGERHWTQRDAFLSLAE